MIISTRGGDAGETSLGDGSKVWKDNLIIYLVGALDECQAHAGAARALADGMIYEKILHIERELGLLMGHISRCEGCECPPVEPLEEVIAEAESKTEKFSFLLPGESQLSAALHIARTVSRRAERLATALFRNGQVGSDALRYLNRLSDYFYALAIIKATAN
ncbi:MAG: cob(I)yrinic acid a,c-diamide adenosyltransferase [Synergistaceae bacterium]|nr:cob(I)yrinic acid a,c-diamide adenosyltransferase [Synergistaceae bacterium]